MSSSSSSSPSVSTDAETLKRSRILSSKLYFDIPHYKIPLIYSSDYDISFLGMEKMHPFDSSKWGRICQFLSSDGVLDKNCIVEPLEASKVVLKKLFTLLWSYRHPFDSSKWGRICQFLSSDGVLDKNCIVEPLEASKEDLLVVHSESYLKSLKSSPNVSIIIEVPPVALFPNCLVQRKVLYPFRKQVGGTILAAKLAKERGWAINVGGGFHHCSADEGGGFCAYADISLCIHYAFVQLKISRVMIIDLDAHQGNGHEKDFSSDSRVYILDMFNPGIYPLDYEARRYIDQKVEVVSGTTTNEYLKKLDEALENLVYPLDAESVAVESCSSHISWIDIGEVAGRRFDPELVIYNAGTDILEGDPLGRLKINPDGIATRDEKIFRFARSRNIPLVMLTSGGYMKSSARVIANSVENLSRKGLINIGRSPVEI